MKVIRVQARALTPLTLSTGAGDNTIGTLDRIPGSTIRGALASHLLLGRGRSYADSPEFHTLFLSDRVLFRDAVPEADGAPVRPVPATSLTCRRLLWQHVWYDLLLSPGLPGMEGLPRAPAVCPVCRAPLQPWEGMVSEPQGCFHRPERAVKTGAEIEDATQSTRVGRLFSREYLERGTSFSGSVVIADGVAFPRSEPLEVRVGRRKSTQGLVRLEFPSEAAAASAPLADRLKHFEPCKQDFGMGPEEVLFSLTCLSDTAIADRCLRCLDRIPEETLCKRLEQLGWQGKGSVRMLRMARRTRWRLGWHAAHGLPKEPLPVISPGSVFLYAAAGDRPSLEQALARLELEGIGLRRNEGLGQVLVCDPWAVRHRYQAGGEGGSQ